MSKYIYLEQTEFLPLLDKELLYINPQEILISTTNREKFLSNIDTPIRNKILIGWVTREIISIPRFNLSTYFYKIKTNPKINILPNGDAALDTDTLFDSRSLELLKLSEKYNRVYLFWSGGVDSTLMLTAVLKNWSNTEKLTIVLNHFSIEEHPAFYQNYIKDRLSIVSTDDFFDCKIKFTHDNLYVTGDVGDPLFTFDQRENFETTFPNIINMSWKKKLDSIYKFYSANSNKNLAKHTISEIIKTSSEAQVPLETVHDFLWWVNYNWGYDGDLMYMLWQYQELSADIDTKKFIEENVFYWFNSVECQNWTLSLSGSDQKLKDGIFKYPLKKYIYDFGKDKQYFQYKKKEHSTPKNPQVIKNKQVMAIDTDYNLYYRPIKI